MTAKQGPLRQANVAVIGAGPCGLAVARELLREGHSVTVFEAGSGVGGAWLFDAAATDSDLLGLQDNRARVHSSMYPGLRTNLPRQVMSLCDFPFSSEALGSRAHDPRPYPLHSEVLAFCETLADAAGLRECTMLHTRVLRIDPLTQHSTAGSDTDAGANIGHSAQSNAQTSRAQCDQQWQHGLKWRVLTEPCSIPQTAVEAAAAAAGGQEPAAKQTQEDSTQQGSSQQQEWVFDAVASCVGIFSEISLPQVPGMAQWPGLQLHSHNFRGASPFKGQKVMVVGASFSGEEIARHIAREAREVLHSARTFTGPGTAREQQQHTCTAPGQTDLHAVCRNGSGSQLRKQSRSQQSCTDQQQQPKQQHQQQPEQQQPKQQHQQQTKQQQQQQQGSIPPAAEPRPNITRLPMLQQLLPDGSAVLTDGQVVAGLDAIVYCTGYKYSLPWMEHLQLLTTEGACVQPLFLHMFPCKVPWVGPSLAICGLPWRCAKFPQFQLQGQLLARLLSGRVALPPLAEMQQEQQQLFAAMQAQGIPLRYTHCMASFMPQDEWQYADQLVRLATGQADTHTAKAAAASGSQQGQERVPQQQQQQPSLVSMPAWLVDLAKAVSPDILGRPDSFRDEWSAEADALMAAADAAMHVQHLQQCRAAAQQL